jgi:crotonobetaine/carnitine-CoA ligase
VPAGTGDEVMLAVGPVPGASLDGAELVQRVDAVLPRFARPRYVELVDELPRTPTAKVRKAELRRRAVTPSTWDRAAGAADVG